MKFTSEESSQLIEKVFDDMKKTIRKRDVSCPSGTVASVNALLCIITMVTENTDTSTPTLPKSKKRKYAARKGKIELRKAKKITRCEPVEVESPVATSPPNPVLA